MLDLIPDHLRLFVVLGGLLFTMLLVGSLAQKYEQYMASKRLAVQRLLLRVRQIEGALEKTRSVGLPPGVGKLLRNELLARYITIRQIYSKQPQINQQIAQADERARSEPAGSASVNAAAITSSISLNSYVTGLNEVIGLLHSRALGRSISDADRSNHQLKLLDFQLSAASRFYTKTALEFAQKGEWDNAARNARILESFLISKPRTTPLANQLREEAKSLTLALNAHRMPGTEPVTSPQEESS